MKTFFLLLPWVLCIGFAAHYFMSDHPPAPTQLVPPPQSSPIVQSQQPETKNHATVFAPSATPPLDTRPRTAASYSLRTQTSSQPPSHTTPHTAAPASTEAPPASVVSPRTAPEQTQVSAFQAATPDLQQTAPILVPQGAMLPAAFQMDEAELTAEQQRPLDAIADNFIEEAFQPGAAVSQIDETAKPEAAGVAPQQDRWTAAVDRADELYRTLYGDQAYMTYGAEAAIEAMAEKQ